MKPINKHMAELDQLIPGIKDNIWNIAEVIEQRAARQPAALALILPDRLISYAELAVAINAAARHLLAQGAQPGQVFGVSMGQTILHLVTLLALARIGAIGVPLHHALPAERRVLVAKRFNITAVLSGRAEMELPGWPFISLAGLDLSKQEDPPLPPSGARGEDPCWLSLSSGTTGDPKGVLRTHGYLLDRVLKSIFVRTPQTRLMPMDLNFGVGFGQAMRMLVLGGTVVLAPDMHATTLTYMVRSHAVTHWLVSPAIAEEVLALLKEDDIHFPSLTYLQIMGATPSRRLLDMLFRRFTPNVYVSYGTSEIGPIATATPAILRQAPDSVGEVSPWLQLELVDEQDRPVEPGQSGRMRVKLDQMFNGYHDDRDMTSTRFRDGWHYTADHARRDAQGLLYIDGREDDVYNIGGGKGQFSDIDKMFQSHPGIQEAVAFVVPRASGQDMLAVAVIASQALATTELLLWGAAQLGPLHPKVLYVVDGFERTATGKAMRDRLARLHGNAPCQGRI